jgi:hypothetical protein
MAFVDARRIRRPPPRAAHDQDVVGRQRPWNGDAHGPFECARIAHLARRDGVGERLG